MFPLASTRQNRIINSRIISGLRKSVAEVLGERESSLLALPPQELIDRVYRYNRSSNKSTGALAVADIVKQVTEQLKSEARPGIFAITDGARQPPTLQLANTSLDSTRRHLDLTLIGEQLW
jgi:hypothetical protein